MCILARGRQQALSSSVVWLWVSGRESRVVRCVGVELLGRRGGRDVVVEAGTSGAEYAGGLCMIVDGLYRRGGLVINHNPGGRERDSILPGRAFSTIETARSRVAVLLDGREGPDVDVDALKCLNGDSASPTAGAVL